MKDFFKEAIERQIASNKKKRTIKKFRKILKSSKAIVQICTKVALEKF